VCDAKALMNEADEPSISNTLHVFELRWPVPTAQSHRRKLPSGEIVCIGTTNEPSKRSVVGAARHRALKKADNSKPFCPTRVRAFPRQSTREPLAGRAARAHPSAAG